MVGGAKWRVARRLVQQLVGSRRYGRVTDFSDDKAKKVGDQCDVKAEGEADRVLPHIHLATVRLKPRPVHA